jgi:hypothetical protein
MLTTFDLSPLNLFDSKSGGLHVRAQMIGRVPEEESKITRIVRTSEGKAIGVVRSEGGETWKVKKNGSDLVRSERWSTADLVAVLDRGVILIFYKVVLFFYQANARKNVCNLLHPGQYFDTPFDNICDDQRATHILPLLFAFQ